LLNCEELEETFSFKIENGDAQDCVEPTVDEVKNKINNLGYSSSDSHSKKHGSLTNRYMFFSLTSRKRMIVSTEQS